MSNVYSRENDKEVLECGLIKYGYRFHFEFDSRTDVSAWLIWPSLNAPPTEDE